jgi:hypothetical protein
VQTKVDSWTEQWASYLIQEDVTVVHQYFDIHRSQNRLEPEKGSCSPCYRMLCFAFRDTFAREAVVVRNYFGSPGSGSMGGERFGFCV